MFRLLLRAVLSSACVAAAACGRAAGDPTDDASGGARVHSADPVWAAGSGWTVAPGAEVSIGQVDGPDAYNLHGVVTAVRLGDGRIAVANRGTRNVRLYTTAGEHLRTIGREGEGPGEFRLIDWMGAGAADSLYVWDSYLARLSVFTSDGELVRSVRVEGLSPFPTVLGMLGDRSLLVSPGSSRGFDPTPGEFQDSVTFLRVDAGSGAVVGTVGPFLKGERYRAVRGMRSFAEQVIFGNAGRVAAHPRGLYVGETNRFRVTLLAAEGESLRTVSRSHRPTPATARDVAATLHEMRRSGQATSRAFPDMAAVQEQAFRELPHRKTLPAFDRLLVDGAGNLWVEEFRVDTGGAPTWSVFDPAGRWLGRVSTPAGTKILTIEPEWILGLVTDDLGIERVVLHRLHRGRVGHHERGP